MRDRLNHRVFGYGFQPDELVEVMIERMERKFGWKTEPSWYVVQPGVIASLFFSSDFIGKAGDCVMAPSPNYHYFLETAAYTSRDLQTVRCNQNHGRWELDFQSMAEQISSRTKTFLFCNPFNPVGRVLDHWELEKIAELCLSAGTVISSDEIHADLVLDRDKKHIPIATIDPEVEQRTITLVSAAKAFNLSGIGGLSYAIIPNRELRKKFRIRSYGVASHPSALAYIATLVALRDCDDWLSETVDYLRSNRDYLESEISSIDGLSISHIEATYLGWINVTDSGLRDPFAEFLKGGVALSEGGDMGRSDFLRLNFACHRETLEEMLSRMKEVLKGQ